MLRRGRAREGAVVAGAAATAGAARGESALACRGACLMYTVKRQYLRAWMREERWDAGEEGGGGDLGVMRPERPLPW